jgi:hypothetical protein
LEFGAHSPWDFSLRSLSWKSAPRFHSLPEHGVFTHALRGFIAGAVSRVAFSGFA